MHNLHTFEHRLICIYSWTQQEREKNKKIGRKRATVAPYFEKIRRKCTISARYPAASSPRRSFASTPWPPLHQRWRGGQGVRPATIRSTRRSIVICCRTSPLV